MCLIILAPKGVEIPSDYITNAWNRNPDGAGVAHVKDNMTTVKKGLMKLVDLRTHLTALGTDVPRLVHFRYATLGAVTRANTHPFTLNKSGSAVCHNGPSLSDSFQGCDKRSDSRHFAEDILMHLDAPSIKRLKPVWEGFIEQGNKLAFLFNDGTHMLVNEKLGTWRDGMWLSNTYSVEKPYVAKPYTPSAATTSFTSDPPVVMHYKSALGESASYPFYYDHINGDYYSYVHQLGLDDYLDNISRLKLEGTTDTWEYTYTGLYLSVHDSLAAVDIPRRGIVAKPRIKFDGDIFDKEYPWF